MKKILVTGGSGFIGTHVVMLLRQQGHEVRSLSRQDGDFHDPDFCDQVVKGIEIVVHLAWSTVPHTSISNPVIDITDNVVGSVTLFKACVEAEVERVVFLSSGGTVYGVPETKLIHEEHPIRPISSYGITKATVERYLHFFHENSALNYVVLRAANAYGPGQQFSTGQGVIGNWLNGFLKNESITICGDGSQVRDFIYISDLAMAVALSIEGGSPPLILNVGSGRGYSLMEVLEIVKAVTKIEPEIASSQRRSFDVPRNVLDCEQVKSQLDWSSDISLNDGIQKMWKWMQDQEVNER